MELLHITATYSNALLVAILPHVTDLAKKLELPISTPVETSAVTRFVPSPYKGRVEGGIWLTNGYWFHFSFLGYIDGFRAPKNWFHEGEYALDHIEEYVGETRMTTNEIVALARESLLKLGYGPELTHAETTPEMEGPSTLNDGRHIPYCKVTWAPVKDLDSDGYSEVKVLLNTQEKTLLGLYLGFARTNRNKIGTPLKVDVEPELESEFRKRTKANLFVRTNAPPRLPSGRTQAPVEDSGD